MSGQETTEKPTAKPKLTPVESAQAKAVQILNQGIAIGKAEGKSESKDPRRKSLGTIANTIAGRAEKGKEIDFKQVKSAWNSLDDSKGTPEEYGKAKRLFEVIGQYWTQLSAPEKPKPTA